MNAGHVWWGQIGNSMRLLTQVANTLRDCRCAVLQVPATFPWRQEFYEAIDLRRSAFSWVRSRVTLAWEPGVKPGELVLRELCSARVHADYYPGMTYAKYLGSLEDLPLNDYYVWVTGIHSQSDLSAWVEFTAEYERTAAALDHCAVFILEYDGPDCAVSGVEHIRYTVKSHDCRVFCLETAETLDNTGAHAYQAELALCIGDGDPELCSALLDTGERLLHAPVRTAMEVLGGCGSMGQPFRPMTEQQISSAAWKAAIGLLFPIMEQYRLDFVASHRVFLSQYLPIRESNGEMVTDPNDLELGPMSFIVSHAKWGFIPEEAASLALCRRVRNLLAHNKPVPYEDVEKILAL